MRRITTTMLGVLAFAACSTLAYAALPGQAVVHTRVFDDCPISVLTVTNNFPLSIVIDDQNPPSDPQCVGFANLHTWRFSSDGVNAYQFQNGDQFEYECDYSMSGIGEGEGGLNLAPWWSPDADGLFNCRTTDGEIACFGGRMPFFSFTGTFGLHYVKGTTIHLGISYLPRLTNVSQPAQVIYRVRYNSIDYSSGLLTFDQGNPAEDPPHGQYGALNPWFAGGHMKMFVNTPVGQPHGVTATWSNTIASSNPTPARTTTWGRLKTLYH